MAETIPGYIRAGRLIRFLAWLQFVVAALVFLGGVTAYFGPADQPQKNAYGGAFIAAAVLIALISAFQLWVGKAIYDHKDWGRTAGIVLGILSLPNLPIGTILGGFILFYLIKGWEAPPPAA